ncbi:hypothetical protein RRG08_020170 [Elysia crispata]|uniref:Cytochrome P450 n=1 Tax=Elysia crispata TaxID=231223 RepID=A0AAE0YBV4_9GAST|nr:hypothetical protein RRG08_020170 [Elysia crispata]
MWFMLYMLHYPEVQAKIFGEITDVVGLERPPDMYDRSKLNFTVATIMEIQRISSAPFNLPHQCSTDTVINGYTIPAGTSVISNINSILTTTDTWKDPEKFSPERFLDAQGILKQPEQFIPFGIGRRACPGESLAKMELFLFLSSLVQRLDLWTGDMFESMVWLYIPDGSFIGAGLLNGRLILSKRAMAPLKTP